MAVFGLAGGVAEGVDGDAETELGIVDNTVGSVEADADAAVDDKYDNDDDDKDDDDGASCLGAEGIG
jgi:hypothetical protein